jgi:LytS/YehU family sensor histidine kinase
VIVVLGWAVPLLAHVTWSFMTDPGSLAVLFVLFTVGGWGLGRDIELEEGLKEEQMRAEKLAVEAERAQLLALRAHLDPHFLFNTLNAIAEWCRDDPEVAERATLKLADMLRTVLEGVKTESWSLARELELLENLFELYRVRDSDRYIFTVDHVEPLPEAEVPPMLLLPLVENAIKHGPSAGHRGEVRISVESDEKEQLRVEIRNPGKYTGRRKGGEGLAMVEKRLALSYTGETRLELICEGEGTVTLLEVPGTPADSKESA